MPSFRTNAVSTAPVGLGSSLSGGNINIRVTQTTHGLVVGDIIRFSGGVWTKAKGDTLSNSQSLSVVTEIVDTNNFYAVVSGTTDKLSGLSPGTMYYLSTTTAGAVTAFRPSTIGAYLRPVYFAITASKAIVLSTQSIEIGSGTGYVPEPFPDHISPVGTIQSFAGPETAVPTNWVLCDGSALSKSANSAEYLTLYNTISNGYHIEGTILNRSGTTTGFPAKVSLTGGGHDLAVDDLVRLTFTSGVVENAVVSAVGSNTITFSGSSGGTANALPVESTLIQLNFNSTADKFFVPDLRGRTSVGAGLGNTLTLRTQGDMGGEEQHQLTTDELPSHSHNFTRGGGTVKANAGTGFFVGSTSAESEETGSDSPHNNMQPFLVSPWIMRAKPITETAFIGPTGARGATGAIGVATLTEDIDISGFTRAVGLS